LKKIKILLIEDDELAAKIMHDYLYDFGFEVCVAFDAREAVNMIHLNSYDLLILDINLPDYSGLEVIKRVQDIPIIVTSAYNDKNTKLKAFKYGASDYMTKPIDLDELEARIWVHLKNNSEIKFEQKKNEKEFALKDGLVFRNGNALTLTTIENEILTYLIKNENRVIKREELNTLLLHQASSNRSLDNHIKNLRKKIGDTSKNTKYLKTVYGVGYYWNSKQ